MSDPFLRIRSLETIQGLADQVIQVMFLMVESLESLDQ